MAVKLLGAKLVLVDVNENNLGFNIRALKEKINKKTKAIIPVHISGRSADIYLIKKILKNKNIKIVEDAAEALFSKNKKGKYLGTIGDLGCFSLTASKTITTGQGGIIVTNNSKLYKKIKLLKNQGIVGRSDGGNVKHTTVGFNFKYTNLQAAMGLAQISTLKERANKLVKINRLYSNKLNIVKEIKVLKFDYKNGEVPLWTDAKVKDNRDKLIDYLKKMELNVESFGIHFINKNHLKKMIKNLKYLPQFIRDYFGFRHH